MAILRQFGMTADEMAKRLTTATPSPSRTGDRATMLETQLAAEPERDDLAQPEAVTATGLPRHLGTFHGRTVRHLRRPHRRRVLEHERPDRAVGTGQAGQQRDCTEARVWKVARRRGGRSGLTCLQRVTVR